MAPRDYAFNTQRRLLGEWEDLLTEIRELPGFQSFLLPPAYATLQAASKDGPILVLNSSDTRCGAIIVHSTGPPSLVPLPNISVAKLLTYSNDLLATRGDPRNEGPTISFVLQRLWHEVVSPIVGCLALMGVPKYNRIWWCPCSEFSSVPLHAAGLYDGNRSSNFPGLYISSYTSTISGLLRAKAGKPIPDSKHLTPRLLFIGHTGGNLSNIEEELASIRCTKVLETKALLEKDAVKEVVLSDLAEYPWAHFSCHGCILPERPLDSYFQLENRHLSVKDIIKGRLDHAEFAFLSACNSAAAGDLLPNESIHLAGALQFSGFRSVVGTMWEMYDSEGPEVTRDFYKKLMKLGGRYTDTAEALHYAIRRCARRCAEKRMGPERWAMFVHIGA